MIWLIPLFLLTAAGIFIAYSLSAAARARKRASKAVTALRAVDSELRSRYQEIQNSVSQAANSYIQEVRAGRLRSIPLDELKRHGSGLRLQALRDAGIRTLADLQGWNESRLSQVRGVGAKSASSIARLVNRLSSASNDLPIRPPSLPFTSDRDYILLQAIYRDCWFETHLSRQQATFQEAVTTFDGCLSQIREKTGLVQWLWRFGGNNTARAGIAAADILCRDLEGVGPVVKLREEVSGSLATCHSVCSNRIEPEVIVADYREKQALYDWILAKNLGHNGQLGQRPTIPNSTSSTTIPSYLPSLAANGSTGSGASIFSATKASSSTHVDQHQQLADRSTGTTGVTGSSQSDDELVHVEFGRVVRGPAPLPLPQLQSQLPTDPPRRGKLLADAERLATRQASQHLEDSALTPPSPTTGISMAATIEEITQHPSRPSGEVLATFRVGVGSPSTTQEFTLPAQARPNTSKSVRWVAKGETITAQGFSITKGLLFYGEAGFGGEQCAIDPGLPATTGNGSHMEATASYHSYLGLTPEQRFGYLAWLSAEANSNDEPGLGMLYFAGLERRLLLILAAHDKNAASGEQEDILNEISRLAILFQSTRGAVTHFARRLLEFVAARSLSGSSLPQLPEYWEHAYELPPSLLYGLGYLMRDKQPIPVEWALRWAYVEPTIYLRTPATRCKGEYEAAFAHIYKERFGNGLVIPPNKTVLKINYQPMSYSPGISGNECKFAGIPDVRALTTPQQTLREIVEQSTAMVDAYSRFIGRNAAKAGTLEAYLMLSPVLWPEKARERLLQIQTNLANDLHAIPFQSFLQQLGCDEELSSSKTAELVKSLLKVSLGFEPDVLTGAKRPRPTDKVVVFPLSADDDPDRTTPEYRKASLTVGLAATVALADGHASELETEAVDQMISRWTHLHLDLRRRLRAQYLLQVHQPTSLAGLKARLISLTAEDRTDLAFSMSALANIDGVVSPEEVKLLEQVYRTLDLDSQTLYTHLHGGGSRQRQSRSFLPPSENPEAAPSFLDVRRIRELRRETDAVAELLAGVFVEDEADAHPIHQMAGPKVNDTVTEASYLLPGLDIVHHKFLSLLLTNPVWSRADLVRAAGDRQIMLDGALERINEAALDFSGDVLIEGDDPIYVQLAVLENAQ